MFMHINIVPFGLVCVNIWHYPLYLVCAFLYLWSCIRYQCVEIFYEDVWRNPIAIGRNNERYILEDTHKVHRCYKWWFRLEVNLNGFDNVLLREFVYNNFEWVSMPLMKDQYRGNYECVYMSFLRQQFLCWKFLLYY